MARQILLSLLFLSLALPANGAEKSRQLNPLEKMLAGFSTCMLPDVNISEFTKEARHPYLAQLAKTGMRINENEGFAYFNNIEQQFYGVKVLELMVPAGTWPVYQLVIDVPHTKVRPILEKELRVNLPQKSPLPEDSDDCVPVLRAYPKQSKWSVLECVCQ